MRYYAIRCDVISCRVEEIMNNSINEIEQTNDESLRDELQKRLYDQFVAGKEKVYVEKIESVPSKPFYEFIKRLIDIVVSLIVLSIAFVPMVVIAIIIRCDSVGSPIFVQERLGYNQKPFKIYKFRSMRIDAEKDGARWATESDDRVTKVGRILRKTRMDELPQFVNILLGQMTFVGPRPERAEFYDVFDLYIDGFRQRMLVKPGLTGHAQVNGGYNLLPEQKIIYDIEYIKNRSLAMDFKCVFNTVRVIIKGDGAR